MKNRPVVPDVVHSRFQFGLSDVCNQPSSSQLAIAEELTGNTIDLEGQELVSVPLGFTDTASTTSLHVPSIGLIVEGEVMKIAILDDYPERRFRNGRLVGPLKKSRHHRFYFNDHVSYVSGRSSSLCFPKPFRILTHPRPPRNKVNESGAPGKGSSDSSQSPLEDRPKPSWNGLAGGGSCAPA